MNYHGVVSDAANPMKGLNYGYPACFAAWQTSNIPSNAGITIGSQFGGVAGTPYEQVTSRTSAAEVDEFCRTERQGPRTVFPSHTAPLDIKFKEDGSAAYVSFHGSWLESSPLFDKACLDLANGCFLGTEVHLTATAWARSTSQTVSL